jgi:acyl-CoA thioester hydrolase
METKIFYYPMIIKEIYLDLFGHVNNSDYLVMLEEARWQLITDNGFGVEKIKKTALGPTILGVEMKFLKELKARDEIIIESEMLSYKNKIGILQQRMLRDGELCCVADFKIALFNLKERKLIVPTEDWLYAIGIKL